MIANHHLLDNPDNLGPGDIKWNWVEKFQLLNGNIIKHQWNTIIVIEGYGDTPEKNKRPSFHYTKSVISVPNSMLAGNPLETLLILSYNDTRADFKQKLLKSGISNGQYSFEKDLKKFAYRLG